MEQGARWVVPYRGSVTWCNTGCHMGQYWPGQITTTSRPNITTSRPNYLTFRPNYLTLRPNYLTFRPNYRILRPNTRILRPSTRILRPSTRILRPKAYPGGPNLAILAEPGLTWPHCGTPFWSITARGK